MKAFLYLIVISGGKEEKLALFFVERFVNSNSLILVALRVNHDVCFIENKNLQ